METVQFQLLAGDTCFPIARELREILLEQGFSPSQLALIEPEELPHASLQPSSCFVLVYDDVSILARSVEPLRKLFPHSVILFVNVFPSSTPAANLLAAGFDDFLPFPFVSDSVCSRIRANLTRNHVIRRQEADMAKHQLKVEVGLSDRIDGGP